MFKTYLLLLLFSISLFASSVTKLLIEAQEFEDKKDYEKAMQIYKQIAIEQTKVTKVYVDEANLPINTIEDEKTQNTIQQILYSAFDFYPYENNYFMPFTYDLDKKNDRNQSEVKFQISVKKPLIKNLFNLNETIYFGYTQTSWWQLYEDSSPFRESNYKPEFFMQIPYGEKDNSFIKGFKIGAIHESNGQNHEDSRSWNRVYLTTYLQTGNLFIAPRIWYRIPENSNDDDNPDINKYLGYGDLTLMYPYKEHTFKLLLRNNLRIDENKGFAQFDWTFPFFDSKNIFGYIQASTGYGESLIDYDKEVNKIGFGLSISR